MGYLKDIANQPKLQTFPNSTFEIAEDVPESQCSEAKIEGDHGETTALGEKLTDTGAFTGFDLTGKMLTVLSPPNNAKTETIINNTNDWVEVNAEFTDTSSDNVYYIHNGGSLILTRDLKSFAQFIQAAGYAYTIKAGKLTSNIPSAALQNACTILFDPLT